jgi:hypothetical protein
MRAIVVELAGPDDAHIKSVLEGIARRLGPGQAGTVGRGIGQLAAQQPGPSPRDREGEPE